jgi:uncharacterized protein
MSTGLSEEVLARIRSVFAEEKGVERVVLYGSRAKGNYKNGSDIDLAIDGSSLDFRSVAALETRLDDLLLPWKIDLALIRDIDNPALLDHIERVGKPLFARSTISRLETLDSIARP